MHTHIHTHTHTQAGDILPQTTNMSYVCISNVFMVSKRISAETTLQNSSPKGSVEFEQ